MKSTKRWSRPLAVLMVICAVAAACGGGRDDDDTATPTTATTAAGGGGGTTTAAPAAGLIDASRCENTTQGLTDTTIKLGVSHPESGPAAAFGQIAEGFKAYFAYVNAEESGVQGRQIELVVKDDGYEAGRTVTNVNEMLQKDQVFALFQNVGTPNNLAIWDQVEQLCVPNLLAATGSQALVDPEGHPFTIIANPAYATESASLVQYLTANNPGAAIALLYANDDYGNSYLAPLEKAIEGTDITIGAKETYEPTDPNVDSQITTLAASGANALFIGATGLKCPQAMDAAAGKGFDVVYLSGTCTSNVLMGLAKPESTNGVISTIYTKDPVDPQFASDPAVALYKEKMAQYAPGADANNGLVAYGWTQGAVLVEILKAAEPLDRVSVVETARSLTLEEPPGLFYPGIPWALDGETDGFPIETFFLARYDSAAKVYKVEGDPIDQEANTGAVL